MKFKTICTTTLLVVFGFSFFLKENLEASQTISLSFSQALKLAQEKPVEVILASQRVKEALAQKGQATSYFFPQLDLEISQKRMTRDLRSQGIQLPGVSESVVGPFNSFDGRVRLNQMIFDWSSVQRLIAVCDGQKLAQAEYEKAKDDAMALVATFYIEADQAAQKKELITNEVALSKKRLQIAHRRHRVGQGLRADIQEAKAMLKDSVAHLKSVQTQQKARLLDLTVALGFDERYLIRTDTLATLKDFKIPTDEEIVQISKDHPDVEVAKQLLKERQSARNVEWAEVLPKFSAFADYGLSGKTPSDSNDTYTLGIQGSLPIFEGGKRIYKIKEAESKLDQAKTQAKDVQAKTQARALVAAGFVDSSLAILNAQDAWILVNQIKLGFAQNRRARGSGSDWELLETSYQYALSKLNRSTAVSDYILSRVNLAHALGKMQDLIMEGSLN